MARAYLQIDCSDAMTKINDLSKELSVKQTEKMVHDTLVDTSRKTKTMVKRDVSKHYAVPQSFVAQAMGSTKLSGMNCSIPLKGKRGTIGGRFKASGGAIGWESLVKNYRVKAKIIKGKTSTLPPYMSHQGHNKPWRNLHPDAVAKLHGATFVRAGKKRLPIKHVSGLAAPQMPLNQAEDDIQKDIQEYMSKRIEHHFERVVKA